MPWQKTKKKSPVFFLIKRLFLTHIKKLTKTEKREK